MYKFLLKLFCILIPLLSLTSCIFTPNSIPSTTTPPITSSDPYTDIVENNNLMRLTYSVKDSLNPYKLETVTNRSLMSLIYEPLFTVNKSFDATSVIVKEYYIDNLDVNIVIKDDILFSNSDPLTTTDIYYSCTQAQKNSFYSSPLENINKIKIISPTEITFQLKKYDPVFINALNFPIIKNKTADNTYPIGSGRYLIAGNENDKEIFLTRNENFNNGKQAEFEKILLYDYSDPVSAGNNIESGNLDLVFDELSDGTERRINAATRNVPINNLVFIGMNTNLSGLSRPYFRQAISKAISRDAIVSNAYKNHATETVGPFNPNWSQVKGIQDITPKSDIETATELLKESTKSGYEFDLIVNEGNVIKEKVAKIIAEQLLEINVTINVKVVTWEQYEKKIKNGDFDLYLGEIRIPQNMDISPLIFKNETKPIGIFYPKSLQRAYNSYRDGTQSLETFIQAFESTMPLIPICYRDGIVVHSRRIVGEITPSQDNIFENIENWSLS